ncbi:MAG: hypothetical protein WAT67_13550 [Candidatus Contendobacter sp.]
MEKITRIVKLLPLLTLLINAAEQALPLPKAGAAKLALVKDILLALDSGLTEFWPLIERLIGGIVGANNAAAGSK